MNSKSDLWIDCVSLVLAFPSGAQAFGFHPAFPFNLLFAVLDIPSAGDVRARCALLPFLSSVLVVFHHIGILLPLLAEA